MLGGPIGLVHEGDLIEIDANARRLSLLIDDAELARRKAAWRAPKPHYTSGVLAKYAATAHQADDGAATNILR